MKHTTIGMAALAVLLCSNAFAQRGRGQGVGQGMGRAGAPPHQPATSNPSSSSGHASAHTGNAVTRLSHDQALSAKLQPMLPAGTNLQTAASGFKNTGQFVAAVHVSRNLNVPFDQLKTRMTGPNRESLGQAIHNLRPDLDDSAVSKEVKTAQRQAKDDLKHT